MVQVILVGIGAGLAAALLFLAPASGSPLALPLFILTGLPLVIAGLGWTVLGGAIAAASGGIVVGAMLATLAPAAIFVLVFGAPIVWLTRLAGLSRPKDANSPASGSEWFPLDRLLLHVTLAVGIGLAIAGVVMGYDPEGIAREATVALLAFLSEVQSANPPPTEETIAPFVRLYVGLLPFTGAVFMVAVITFNLWLGAWVARASGRLARPAERLWTVTLPNEVLAGFAVTLALAFLPGAVGDIAAVFAGAFGCALVLVGLAVLHALTLGMSGRRIVLGVTYVLILLSGLPLLLFAALGAGESFLHLRARRFGGAPPST